MAKATMMIIIVIVIDRIRLYDLNAIDRFDGRFGIVAIVRMVFFGMLFIIMMIVGMRFAIVSRHFSLSFGFDWRCRDAGCRIAAGRIAFGRHIDRLPSDRLPSGRLHSDSSAGSSSLAASLIARSFASSLSNCRITAGSIALRGRLSRLAVAALRPGLL
ncbi:MAG: hypothetical protein ACI9SE_003709, partial [Neolewinella sp.]